MTDPRRWSDEGEADDLTRELLLAGQARQMPEAERRAVWAGLSLALPGAPTAPGVEAAAPAATTALSAYLTKGVIFLATLGGLSVGVLQFLPQRESAAKPTASLPAPAAAPGVSAALAQAEPEAAAETVEVAAPAAPLPSEAKQRVPNNTSQLREESVAVLEARSALRSGDAARSLALLEQARQRFPRGALGQEREALTIEALARSGQAAVARRRADAFLRAYPRSPHVADIRRIAQR